MALLEAFTETLLAWVGDWGLVGIFLLMAIESSLLPFPSEVVMIPAGFLASRGELSLSAAILAGTLGSIVGAWVNYFLARHLGRAAIHRIGRHFFISESTLNRVEAYFDSHGEFTTFVGRLIPAVRQLVSIPAGLARMNLSRFTAFTAAGAGLWVTVLALLGYFLGAQAARSQEVLRTVTLGTLGVVAILIVLYVAGQRYFRRRVAPP